MRNYSKTVGALAAASTLVAGYASAEIEGEVHVGYNNMYEFRFVDLGSDMVEAGVDLSLGEYSGFSFAVGSWYASVNDDDPRVGAFDELDLYASVGYSLGPVDLEAGYIYYYFPNFSPAVPSNTQEFYLSASTEVAWGIGVGATWFYDFDQANGWYLQPEITKSFSWEGSPGSIDLAVGCGIADGHGLQVTSKPTANPGSTADGFQGFYASVAVPFAFSDTVTLTPYVKYTNGDSGLATSVAGTDRGKDYLVAGLKLAVTF